MKRLLFILGFFLFFGFCFSQDQQDVNFHSQTAQQLEEKLIQEAINAEDSKQERINKKLAQFNQEASTTPASFDPTPVYKTTKKDFDDLAYKYCYGADMLYLNRKESDEKLKDELRQDYTADSDAGLYGWNYKTGEIIFNNETSDRALNTLLRCEFFTKSMQETFKTDKKTVEYHLKRAENFYLKGNYPAMTLNLIAAMSLAHPLTKKSMKEVVAQSGFPKKVKY